MTLAPTKIIVASLIAFAAVLVLPGVIEACPNCKKGLGANNMALAYGFSIVLMIGVPFVMLAGWVFIIARSPTIKETRESVDDFCASEVSCKL